MPANDVVKLQCHSCPKKTQHEVLSEQSNAAHAGLNSDRVIRTYQIVQCRGCETISFRELVPSSNVMKIGQRIEVKVLSDRDEPLLLSKREVDALRNKEAEVKRKKEESDRLRKVALRQLRQGDLLEGTVIELASDGVYVKATKGNIIVEEGWVPASLFEPRGRSAYRRGLRIPVLVTEVRTNDSWLVLSHRDGLMEEPFLRAERAFLEKSILEGTIVEVHDGKVVVRLGPGCRGIVSHSQLGEGTSEDLREWKDRRIPVRVVGAPTANRRVLLQLSHRAAVKRRDALAEFQLGQQLNAKVGKVYRWGAAVTVRGVDGLISKAEMTSRSIRENGEIQVEVAELDREAGYLGLRLVFADGAHPTSADDTDDADEDGFESEDGQTSVSHMPEPTNAGQ